MKKCETTRAQFARRGLGLAPRDGPLDLVLCTALLCAALLLAGCQLRPTLTPLPTPTSTPAARTPTPRTLTPSPQEEQPYSTYAQGELLPDMRVPIQRSASGEGGWYVIIATEEGWKQWLAQMGQPAEIWQPLHWEQEILIGALLGLRESTGYAITIDRLEIDGVSVSAEVTFDAPQPGQDVRPWITYPFHMLRVPRDELPLGPISFRFFSAGRELASQTLDLIDLDIVWLPGEPATYPTPTPVSLTSTPEPTTTPTPVPNLQVVGTVLEVRPDTMMLRMVPFGGQGEIVELLEATSIFEEGQPASLSQLVPGATIGVLGYPGEGETVRAAHIDILSHPTGALYPPQEEGFAPYKPRSVNLSTIYDGHRLPLSVADISATLPLSQTFGPTQTHVLTHNGFIVVPSAYGSMAALYNDPQHSNDPLFISSDSVAHISQLTFERVLRSTEANHLAPELEMLDVEMFERSWAQYEAVQAAITPEQQRMAATAMRNAAYFAVAASLLNPEFSVPDPITTVVEIELARIAAGEAITLPALLDLPGVPEDEKLRVDYRAFQPGGHYAWDEASTRYWQALEWHRQIAFRLDQREETRSAALIAYTLQTHSAPRVLWQRVQALTAFFYGQDASFTAREYGPLLDETWGAIADLTALADEGHMDAFVASILELPLPGSPMWTIQDAKRPVSREFRFLSGPFQVESYVFEQTTGEQVGDVERPRALPSAVDLGAVLGSLEAYRVAEQLGYTEYADYVAQVDDVRNELAALQTQHWTSDLHWNWLYVYRALLAEKNASYPEWMQTAAWKRKELQTAFGSWTTLRHDPDAALTAAQATEAAAPAEETTPGSPPWGYVEPQPEVYARLAALTRLLIDGLESRLMLSAADRELLLELETWLMFLQDAARRELTAQALTDQEAQRLGEYGVLVERLTLAAYEAGSLAATAEQTLSDAYVEAAAVRVATGSAVDGGAADGSAADGGGAAVGESEPVPVQLIAATGPVDELYVVVERNRKLFLARGGAYTYYEFTWPAADPLTDAQWQALLAAGRAPDRPAWVQAFVSAP